MAARLPTRRGRGFDTIAFGDLFLRDIRAYRERQLAGSGLTPIFPLWEIPTAQLARDMIAGGLRARITCVDPQVLDASLRRPRLRPRPARRRCPPRRTPAARTASSTPSPGTARCSRPHRHRNRRGARIAVASFTPTSMPRIVSLIASATEIVARRSARLANLVGRSHECDWPEAVTTLPVCTRPRIDVHGDSREIDRLVREVAGTALSIYDVYEDVLERLQPTHILTQIQCEVCAVSLRDVERSVARGIEGPRIVSLQPNSPGRHLGRFPPRCPVARHRPASGKRSDRRRPGWSPRCSRSGGRTPAAACRLHRVDRTAHGRG